MKLETPILKWIHAQARQAAPLECMGLLGGNDSVITHAILLPAVAGPAHAVASPRALMDGVQRLTAEKALPCGIWHSHASFAPFHSGTDDETIARLLPALAARRWRALEPADDIRFHGGNTATVPLDDGSCLSVSLTGAPVPGCEGAFELASWAPLALETDAAAAGAATVCVSAEDVVIRQAKAVARLRYPLGCAIAVTRRPGVAPCRATLFSLVVNANGETFGEEVRLTQFGGELFTRRQRSPVETVGPGAKEGAAEAEPANAVRPPLGQRLLVAFGWQPAG